MISRHYYLSLQVLTLLFVKRCILFWDLQYYSVTSSIIFVLLYTSTTLDTPYYDYFYMLQHTVNRYVHCISIYIKLILYNFLMYCTLLFSLCSRYTTTLWVVGFTAYSFAPSCSLERSVARVSISKCTLITAGKTSSYPSASSRRGESVGLKWHHRVQNTVLFCVGLIVSIFIGHKLYHYIIKALEQSFRTRYNTCTYL